MKRKQFNVWMKQIEEQLNRDLEKEKINKYRAQTASKSIKKRATNITKRQLHNLQYQKQDYKQQPRSKDIQVAKINCENGRQVKKMREQTQISNIKQCAKSICQTQSELLKSQLTAKLAIFDPIFRKIQYSLLETIVFISKINIYSQKQTVNFGSTKKIGFIIFGEVLLYNLDYQSRVQRGGTIGEHILFDKKIDVRVMAISETGILWLPLKHFEMLRQQSVKSGLKAQFHQLQAQVRLSFIHKKIK